MRSGRLGRRAGPRLGVAEQVRVARPGDRLGERSAVDGEEAEILDLPAVALDEVDDAIDLHAPAFIGVGSIDLFVDEDVEYARRLLDAGVGCELVVIPGGFHGFDNFQAAPVVKRYREHFMGALRQGLRV